MQKINPDVIGNQRVSPDSPPDFHRATGPPDGTECKLAVRRI